MRSKWDDFSKAHILTCTIPPDKNDSLLWKLNLWKEVKFEMNDEEEYEFSYAFSGERIRSRNNHNIKIGAAELFAGISPHCSLWIFISEDSSSVPTLGCFSCDPNQHVEDVPVLMLGFIRHLKSHSMIVQRHCNGAGILLKCHTMVQHQLQWIAVQ